MSVLHRLLISAAFLITVILPAALAQEQPRTDNEEDVKRCRARVVNRKSLSWPKAVGVRKGEKSTGYPIIAFEILESGEVVNAHVKRSSGIADIDAHALNWFRGTRYNKRSGCGTIESEAIALIHFVAGED